MVPLLQVLPQPSNQIKRRFSGGSVAQLVEQRPFKALVPGSSPGRPISIHGLGLHAVRDVGRHYFATSDRLDERVNEHRRGSCHTTRRLGARLELVASRQVSSMQEARALEKRLKKMKNPAKALQFLRCT
jgi:predicted GIY-YIG superfamily endonuclease